MIESMSNANVMLGLSTLGAVKYSALVPIEGNGNVMASSTPRRRTNAIEQQRQPTSSTESQVSSVDELEAEDMQATYSLFKISRQVELGGMVSMFCNGAWKAFFNFAFLLYLFGDLVIYASTIAKALVLYTGPVELGGTLLDATDQYKLYLAIFSVFVVPLSCLSSFEKMKYFSYLALAMRVTSFIVMITVGRYRPSQVIPLSSALCSILFLPLTRCGLHHHLLTTPPLVHC